MGEIEALDLRPEARALLLRDNALRIFTKLPGARPSAEAGA